MSGRDSKLLLKNAGEIAVSLIPQTVANLVQGIGCAADHILGKQHLSVVDIFRHGHIRFLFENMCNIFLCKSGMYADGMQRDRLSDVLIYIADDIDDMGVTATEV